MTERDFPPLPEDCYGAYVANDVDLRRLQYLVARVGEAKVRQSAAKGRFQPMFVSTLLDRFRVVVPVSVYAPVAVRLYRVYVLVFPSEGVLKLGMSGHWTQRVHAFAPRDAARGWDDVRSVAVCFGTDKAAAVEAERAIRAHSRASQCPPPGFIAYGAGGKTEWRSLDCYDDLLQRLRLFASDALRPALSLRQALDDDARIWSGALAAVSPLH